MQTIIRTPFFLILFTIFSVSFSVSSATGQTLPVVGGAYQGQPGLPVVDGAYIPPDMDERERLRLIQEKKRKTETWEKIKPFVDKARSFYSSQNITFDNYRPIYGACIENGSWAIVDSQGNTYKFDGELGEGTQGGGYVY